MLRRLTWLEFAIEMEIENFENYIEFMEENILKEQTQLEQSYEEYVKNYHQRIMSKYLNICMRINFIIFVRFSQRL